MCGEGDVILVRRNLLYWMQMVRGYLLCVCAPALDCVLNPKQGYVNDKSELPCLIFL
jgi:hypothetical protein